MTPEEARAFLRAGTRVAKVATTRADGSPHIVPVWYDVEDDGTIVFTCAATSVKGRNLARDPRAAVAVDDEAFPYAFVVVSGRAALAHRPDDLLAWTTRIARRYLEPDRAEEYGHRNAVLDDSVVRVAPDRVYARAEIAF
jgi:PPOX class probable F420-dependent enzyme